MFSLTRLHPIHNCENLTRKADVIFIHGLGGDAYGTWQQDNTPETFWPDWIGEEITDVGVWSLGYAASPSKWLRIINWISKSNRDLGYAMSLPDRARQVLDLFVQHSIGQRPIMFICHSLGGLLVKQILRMSKDASEGSMERSVFFNTRAILFLATPHNGADVATLLAGLRVAFPTLAIEDLRAHGAHLRDLFEWYRDHASVGIQTHTYFESRRIKGVLTVDPTSAHPGVGLRPVPLDEDHISISKPRDRNAQVYIATMTMLRNHVLNTAIVGNNNTDIESLTKLTRVMKSDLNELSKLRVGQSEIKIIRQCAQELRHQVEDRSFVLVGEPGSGKSGVLHHLVSTLLEEGRDTVYIAVDRIDAETLSQLREQLGLQHDLNESLEKWKGNSPAFLIIDALDAARSDRTAQMLSSLLARIVRAKGRWRVVASIRKFDLRHNRELRNIFYGKPPLEKYRDPEFTGVCHVKIPEFSKEELLEVAARSYELRAIVDSDNTKLQQLLRNPFNLRLITELLGEGVSVLELTPIRTQLELLDRYWEERIVQPNDGLRDAREDVLRRAVSQMVESRTFRAPRIKVAKPGTGRALDQILSENVLVEWQPSPTKRPDVTNLMFAHHVLLDYAIERLILRNEVQLTQLLADDPELVMVIRPSLDMHFQHIWYLDDSRSFFWNIVLQVMENNSIPEVGKLIGPAIVAEISTEFSDFIPILHGIEETRQTTNAEKVIQHVIGALIAMEPSCRFHRLVGHTAGPWAELVEVLSQHLSSTLAYIVRMLLTQLCDHKNGLTVEQNLSIGVASRNLLEFAWSQNQRNEWIITDAIRCVSQTYGSNCDASHVLLRRALQKDHLVKHGYRELQCLASEARNVMIYDPSFIRDLYIAAFGYEEKSEDPTPIGGSKILSLISNRRQDYNHGLYQLGELFEDFINQAPFEAIEALISVIEHYVINKHTSQPENFNEKTFFVNDMESVICTDYSSIWNADNHLRHDGPLEMLDVFQTYFTNLGMDQGQTQLRHQLLNIIATHNRMAALWRRLLICGTDAPTYLGQEIRSLCWSLPILNCIDTSHLAGDFIREIYSYLSFKEKEKVEHAILSIPTIVGTKLEERAQEVRDRLLGCLPSHKVCTPEAQQRICELNASGGPPDNVPPFSLGAFEITEYSEREYLADEGVPVDNLANSSLQKLEQPVALFIKKYQKTQPSLVAIKDLLPDLSMLHYALLTAEAGGAHPKQIDYAWGYLAEACACATLCAEITCDNDPGAFLLSVLLEASQHQEPESNPEYDKQFDETPSWGKPAARIDAAIGLIELARFPSAINPIFLTVLERLVNDPVPSVRFQVVVRLHRLYKTANPVMWNFIDRITEEETSRGVLHGLVNVLSRLASRYPDRIIKLTRHIYERTTPGTRLREACLDIFKGLFLYKSHTIAMEMIQFIVRNPLTHSNECQHFVVGLRDILNIGLVETTKQGDDVSVRMRAWAALLQVVEVAKEQWRSLERLAKEQGKWLSEQEQQASGIAQIVDTVCMEIYFSSGAHSTKRIEDVSDKILLSADSQRTFYTEAEKVLDVLADFPIATVTHHLLETMSNLVPVDPIGVFIRIGRTVIAGQDGGYQFESMAADLVVELVERYLAEYRWIFRDNKDCRNILLELLDIFVKVGWPSARRLTYRMDEIFR
ncbi:hypothetical protein EC604_23215 [Paenibacillus amylolyticus]|uniref:Uncharacterized protein n=1 Tax=Paenibacillus amylolyticus TaxID=1451 RepID=A0A5M9WYQ4_PAEAM|nr:hypothetical protein [Paenibacillus amylolyticus]KAA8786741.1 hypothetical protein EC604_23215 [Paenibacillus amylolyticus]